MKTIEQLEKEIHENTLLSAYEISIQIYSSEDLPTMANAKVIRAGWTSAGYDDNGDEVYTP